MKTVRPFFLYGETQLGHLRSKIAPIVAKWLVDWACDRGVEQTATVTLSDVSSLEKSHSYVRVTCIGEGWCAVGLSGNSFNACMSLMFDRKSAHINGAKPGVMGAVVEKALADLASRLVEGAGGVDMIPSDVAVETLPAIVHMPGSGCVVLSLTLADVGMHVVLNQHVVACYVNNPSAKAAVVKPGLISAKDAIGRERVRANVRLGDADLALGALSALQVGDVIELEKRITERCEMVFENSSTRCLGYLGKSDGRYALRIDKVETI